MTKTAITLLAAGLGAAGCATTPLLPPEYCLRGSPGPIEGYWMLERFNGKPVRLAADDRITLRVEADRFRGSSVCNSYNALETADGGPGYVVVNGRLVARSGVVRTLGSCDGAEGRLEDDYLFLLDSAPHVVRDGEMLCLYTSAGTSAEYAAAEEPAR